MIRPIFIGAVLSLALAAASGAHARMYEWVSPDSGSVQLSGTPPSWYRSTREGPRVRVFDNGRLVDDTAIALPRPHADELRDVAFRELEQRRKLDSLRKLEQIARAQAVREAEATRREAEKSVEAAERAADAKPVAADATSNVPDDLTPEAIARLKAIVREFNLTGPAQAAAPATR